MKNLTYTNLHSTVLVMANACPLLQELNLSGCTISISELQSSLKAIAKNFPKLVNLNLTIEPVIDEDKDNYSEIANFIGSLKELRILHISTILIKTAIYKDKWCTHNWMTKNQTKLNEYEEPLWTIVNNCTNIEEFYLSGLTSSVNRIYDESCLCNISQWKKLKKLHLIKVKTSGNFLLKVFKHCHKLEELYFCSSLCSNFDSMDPDLFISFLATFTYAKALKTLRYCIANILIE
ncbi:hypothetical protein CHUAL_010601 [Chamberlinius hualienensis]